MSLTMKRDIEFITTVQGIPLSPWVMKLIWILLKLKRKADLFLLQGDAIQGFSDGMTKWYIEPAGEGLHRVRENISTLLKETTLTT